MKFPDNFSVDPHPHTKLRVKYTELFWGEDMLTDMPFPLHIHFKHFM